MKTDSWRAFFCCCCPAAQQTSARPPSVPPPSCRSAANHTLTHTLFEEQKIYPVFTLSSEEEAPQLTPPTTRIKHPLINIKRINSPSRTHTHTHTHTRKRLVKLCMMKLRRSFEGLKVFQFWLAVQTFTFSWYGPLLMWLARRVRNTDSLCE